MANYCYNWMSFQGDEASIKELKEKAFGTYGDYEYLTKWVNGVIGKETKENFDTYEYGTRWFDFDVNMETFDDKLYDLVVTGDSAWSPPIEMAQAFCNHFNVECTIEYEESGNDFGGSTSINKDGELVDVQDYTYREWRYIQDAPSAIENLIEDLEFELGEGYVESVEEFLAEHPYLSDNDKKEIIEEINKKQIKL